MSALLQDRNIVEMILNNTLDDVKAHLLEEDRNRLEVFEREFNIAVRGAIQEINTEHYRVTNLGLDRKTFATQVAPGYNGFVRPILFRAFGDKDANIHDMVMNTIRANLTKTTKYEEVRDVWFAGVKFNDY